MKNQKELYDFASTHPIAEIEKVLRDYILSGQPEDFVAGATTRSMCRTASMGIEKIPFEEISDWSMSDTKYGIGLHQYMWELN